MIPNPKFNVVILSNILIILLPLLWVSGNYLESRAYPLKPNTAQGTPDKISPPLSPPVVTPAPTPSASTKRQADPEQTSLGSLIFRVKRPARSQPAPQPPAVSFPSLPVVNQADRFILVNQAEQMMYVYESGVAVRAIPVSTGRPVRNAFTPAWRGSVGSYLGGGGFRNTNLRADEMWYLFPGVWGAILIHSVPYTLTGDEKVYDRLDALGVEPTSHGCIRISPEDAEWLKIWNPVDASIQITGWSGQIGISDPELPAVDVNSPLESEETVKTFGAG